MKAAAISYTIRRNNRFVYGEQLIFVYGGGGGGTRPNCIRNPTGAIGATGAFVANVVESTARNRGGGVGMHSGGGGGTIGGAGAKIADGLG